MLQEQLQFNNNQTDTVSRPYESPQPRTDVYVAYLKTLRTGSFKLFKLFKLFKRPFPGFLTILTL